MSGEIRKTLQRKSRARIWSAGSGIDLVSLRLKSVFGDKVETTLLDASEDCVAINRKLFSENGLQAEIVVGDIFESQHASAFDVVMNTGLLEHFERVDQERILSLVSRSLVVGGSYVTLTPYSGARLYSHCLRRARSKKMLSWPETPVTTLRGLDWADLVLAEEYPVCAIDQLASVGLAYPSLGVFSEHARRFALKHESTVEPALTKLIGGYCLCDIFSRKVPSETSVKT
ncbi:MAG TPA: class I SAM-dependent methyltransferase [Thermoplasmata archaeon]